MPLRSYHGPCASLLLAGLPRAQRCTLGSLTVIRSALRPLSDSAQKARVGATETVQTFVVRGHAHLGLEEPVSLHSRQQAEPLDSHGGSSGGGWQPPPASAALSGWAADTWQAQKLARRHAMFTVRAWQAQLTTSSMSASCEAVRWVILAGSASPGTTSLYACWIASL